MKFDFSGYATRNDLKCTDGRTIRKDAFKDNDGQVVPLVWQHMHNDPGNVLGHALLENRKDGVYAYCKFNDTEAGKNAKMLVQHGDITALSIYANQLKEQASNVLHGVIREVSLVLAGANPGALIDNLSIAHADGSSTELSDEAIIYTDDEISNEEIEHGDDSTLQEIFNTLNDEQKQMVYTLVGLAAQGGIEHSDIDDEEDEEDEDPEDEEDEEDEDPEDEEDEEDEDPEDEEDEDPEDIKHSVKGGKIMKRNIFDKSNEEEPKNTLTHAQFATILADAQKNGSLKEAILAHATEYGIENIDVLFPDAKALSRDPEWLKREDDWVSGVLSAIHKSPFSRIKSIIADMNFDEARAKGYIKATMKKEVYLKAAKRVTTPQTVYVKQKLDRDDIIDVTDFDIVAMVRYEMRTLLNEELARAAMFGDGRTLEDPYKINEENIRPIWKEDDLYAIKEKLSSGKTDYKALVKEISLTHKRYKGSGAPVLYMTPDMHTNMLWIEDLNGRRIYESDATLCAALRVSKIVEIPQLEGLTRIDEETGKTYELMGIKVNLKDYNFGADKGGEVASFDDFDIDFNQYKYLMETRCSGALTKPYSAQIYEFEVSNP